MTAALHDRVLGQFPLSIATSLALEGALGIHPDRPSKNELAQYAVVWVNLKTLFRNLYNAIAREEVQNVPPHELAQALAQEIEQFDRLVASESGGKTTAVFYTSDYAGMELSYPHAIIRGDSTPLQLAYTKAMNDTLTIVVKEHKEQFKLYRLKITDSENRKALMLTHYPLDLTTKNFANVSLLESHTGAIKPKNLWYTKFTNGKDLAMIPFSEAMLQIFGDAESFRPLGLNIRKAVIDVAIQYKWSSVTTKDKILFNFDLLKDKFLAETLKKYFR